MTTRAGAGFLPSASGFAFPNRLPHVPSGASGRHRELPIGDAWSGLCGGMGFAARVDPEAGRPPPELEEQG